MTVYSVFKIISVPKKKWHKVGLFFKNFNYNQTILYEKIFNRSVFIQFFVKFFKIFEF